jgi:hypothetical protein
MMAARTTIAPTATPDATVAGFDRNSITITASATTQSKAANPDVTRLPPVWGASLTAATFTTAKIIRNPALVAEERLIAAVTPVGRRVQLRMPRYRLVTTQGAWSMRARRFVAWRSPAVSITGRIGLEDRARLGSADEVDVTRCTRVRQSRGLGRGRRRVYHAGVHERLRGDRRFTTSTCCKPNAAPVTSSLRPSVQSPAPTSPPAAPSRWQQAVSPPR